MRTARKFHIKVLRELMVYGDPAALESLITYIEAHPADGWSRDQGRETELGHPFGETYFCFLRRAASACPAVVLVMSAKACRMRVGNIVPETGQFSRDEYNSILAEFYLRVLHPAAAQSGVAVELSSDEQSVEEIFGSRAVQLLRRFSEIANKSVTHPADRRRWMDFLIHLHCRPHRKYDLSMLARWLVEDGWSRERADRLVAECEFAGDLLRAYDQKPLSPDSTRRTVDGPTEQRDRGGE